MAKRSRALTVAAVDRLQERGFYRDSRGGYLQVVVPLDNGGISRSWIMRYTLSDGIEGVLAQAFTNRPPRACYAGRPLAGKPGSIDVPTR